MAISWVHKKDGRLEQFQTRKILNAVARAIHASNPKSQHLAEKLSQQVLAELEKKFPGRMPSTKDVKFAVEQTLRKNLLNETAIGFASHRKPEAREIFGVKNDLNLSRNAIYVLKKRYLQKDLSGNVIETPGQLFRRVANAIAQADSLYNDEADIKKTEQEFYNLMSSLEFLPNSPALMNAGTQLGQLAACFVLPIEDSIPDIFEALKQMALIHQSGGGTGFSFSRLRPKGDLVKSTQGVASGPVSFLRVFDVATDVIKQGGKRRGANMAVLSVYHPDIQEFISSKSNNLLQNFNISVAMTNEFMKSINKNSDAYLINPRTRKAENKIKARELFDGIIREAWKTGDPGMIFIDEINKRNQIRDTRIETTNPCGEQPLLPYESCILGSINLAKFVTEDKDINWKKLSYAIKTAVHFLDNAIDVNKYPNKQIEEATKANRKIGLGIMGWAEFLIKLKIPYDSSQALRLAEKLMKFFSEQARKASYELALYRGSFPNFEASIWKKKFSCLRNATTTTIAPTGSLSIIADCSSGIEPLFAISFVRNILEGSKLLETNKEFLEFVKDKNYFSHELLGKIAKTGSTQNIKEIPEDIKKIFVVAHDISPEAHVRMQASFQKFTDNAVSKTVNLPESASPEDVRKVFWLAWKLKCKGVTIYRYGSKPKQVLYFGDEQHISADFDYAGGCPERVCNL